MKKIVHDLLDILRGMSSSQPFPWRSGWEELDFMSGFWVLVNVES